MRTRFTLSVTGATAEKLDNYAKYHDLPIHEAAREILTASLANSTLTPIKAKVETSLPNRSKAIDPTNILAELNEIGDNDSVAYQEYILTAAKHMVDSPNFGHLPKKKSNF